MVPVTILTSSTKVTVTNTIREESGNDTLLFGKGVAASDVLLSKSGANLTISVGTNDSITIDDWFTGNDHKVETSSLLTVALTK